MNLNLNMVKYRVLGIFSEAFQPWNQEYGVQISLYHKCDLLQRELKSIT